MTPAEPSQVCAVCEMPLSSFYGGIVTEVMSPRNQGEELNRGSLTTSDGVSEGP